MKAKVLLTRLVLALVTGFGILILLMQLVKGGLLLGIISSMVGGVIIFVTVCWWLGKDKIDRIHKLCMDNVQSSWTFRIVGYKQSS